MVAGLVEVLQVRLQQVGHPALPPQRDQEVDLERIHLLGAEKCHVRLDKDSCTPHLAGILPGGEEAEEGAEHDGVHPGGGELHDQLRDQLLLLAPVDAEEVLGRHRGVAVLPGPGPRHVQAQAHPAPAGRVGGGDPERAMAPLHSTADFYRSFVSFFCLIFSCRPFYPSEI